MHCCVRGTKHKYAICRPILKNIWPLKMGTNLTQDEITSLEEIGFILNECLPLIP
jgi:hypothetical protein